MNWRAAKLVVFDVDGTLYDQSALRARMAILLGLHCLKATSLRTAQILRVYRHEREVLAEHEVEDFEPALLAIVADRVRAPVDKVRLTVRDWIEQRPLPLLRSCRYPGVAPLFDAIRASGRRIGILSDYPAEDKLKALGLPFDHMVSAGDADVRLMKPNPRGLERMLAIAGVDRNEAMLIGDRPERDGAAGIRAGVKTYLIDPRRKASGSRFRSYRDLLKGSDD